MSRAKQSYVATLTPKTEFAFEIYEGLSRNERSTEIKRILRDALRERGTLADRDDPEDRKSIPIQYRQLTIEQGKLVKGPPFTVVVDLHLKRMTEEQFTAKQDELLEGIAPEFRGPISSLAWEDGHSAGLEEVLLYVDKYVTWLAGPLTEYTNKILNQK